MKRNYIISDDLMRRLTVSAQSGDPIAHWILKQFRNPRREEIFESKANYFTCAVDMGSGVRQIRVRYSTMDSSPVLAPELKVNPEAPYTNNRSQICSLSKFLDMFKDFPKELKNDSLIMQFGEIMKLGQRIEVTMSNRYYDFKRAYSYANYAMDPHIDGSTLHNSCMRYDSMNEVVAGFYRHVCGCSIMIAQNEGGQVMGRAIVWPNVKIRYNSSKTVTGSLLSRMYYTCSAVRDAITRAAEKTYGINFRMKQQSLGCHKGVVAMNFPDVPKEIDVLGIEARMTPTPKFAGGIPYVDVFETIHVDTDGAYLTNDSDAGNLHLNDYYIAQCATTGGHIDGSYRICPMCGSHFSPSDRECFCRACASKRTFDIGTGFAVKKIITVPGYGRVPVECTKRGALTPISEIAVLINRLQTNVCDNN